MSDVQKLGPQINAAKRELNDALLPIIQQWEDKYGLYLNDIEVIHRQSIGYHPQAVTLVLQPVTAGNLR